MGGWSTSDASQAVRPMQMTGCQARGAPRCLSLKRGRRTEQIETCNGLIVIGGRMGRSSGSSWFGFGLEALPSGAAAAALALALAGSTDPLCDEAQGFD